MDMNLSKLWEMVKDRETWHTQSMGSQRVGNDWVTEQGQNSDFEKHFDTFLKSEMLNCCMY